MASSFFDKIFCSTFHLPAALAAEAPTVLIPDLSYSTLQLVIRFIYTGNVTLRFEEIKSFVEACAMLQIRGIDYSDNRAVGIHIKPSATHVSPLKNTSGASPKTMVQQPNHTLPQDAVFIELEPSDDLLELKRETTDDFSTLEAGYEERMVEPDQDPLATGRRKIAVFADPETGDKFASVAKKRARRNEAKKTYAVCLKAAITAVLDGSLSCVQASLQHKIARNKLWSWAQQVHRAMDSVQYDEDAELQSAITSAMIDSVLDESKRNVNGILAGDDECAKAAMLDKSVNTLTYDARIMAAHDEIFQRGSTIRTASVRYNITCRVLASRANNLQQRAPPAHKQQRYRQRERVGGTETRRFGSVGPLTGTVRRVYTPSEIVRLKAAIRAVVIDGMDETMASRKYDISRRLIQHRVRNVACLSRTNPPAGDVRCFTERVDAAIETLLADRTVAKARPATKKETAARTKPSMVGTMLRRLDDPRAYAASMREATNAIANGDMTYRQASDQFRLHSSVLCRQVARMKNRIFADGAPQSSEATESLGQAETFERVPEVQQLEMADVIPFSDDDAMASDCEVSVINKLARAGSNDEFKELMTMDIECFETLLRKVECTIAKQKTYMRHPIPARTRLIVTLRYLATGRSFGDLTNATKISKAALSKLIPETCAAIIDQLAEYMHLPQSMQEWEDTAEQFALRWQFPHCLGAIEGSHVLIEKPPNSGSMYYNYKGTHSIVLLAVVDANYQFLTVSAGMNGRLSDGGVLRSSAFGTALLEETLNLPHPSPLAGSDRVVPYAFVGNEACGMHKHVLKPYHRSELNTAGRVEYNARLGRAGAVVKVALARLCEKFKIFQQPIRHAPEKASLIVIAACYLHNFLRRASDPVSTTVGDTFVPAEEVQLRLLESAEANEVREEFCEYLNAEGRISS
uniref:BTB domain-containing protein n=1 Tax=Anopheles dirus TaxID=7168 RepID=A0A182NJ33_9DIPT